MDVLAPPGSSMTEEVSTLFLVFVENKPYYIGENTLNKTNITQGELRVNRVDPGSQRATWNIPSMDER